MPTRYITVHCYTKWIKETTQLHQLPPGRQECHWYGKSSLGEKFHKAWYSQHLQDRAYRAYRFFICSKRLGSLQLTNFTITLLHWLGSLLACALLRGSLWHASISIGEMSVLCSLQILIIVSSKTLSLIKFEIPASSRLFLQCSDMAWAFSILATFSSKCLLTFLHINIRLFNCLCLSSS